MDNNNHIPFIIRKKFNIVLEYYLTVQRGEKMFKLKSILVMSNVIFSGLIAILISYFFADGAIGDAATLTPEFFLILPVWAIGALLMWRFVSKKKLENTSNFKIIISNLLLWVTIPVGFILVQPFI